MWEFSGAGDESRFLILARSRHRPVRPGSLAPELRERLILYGALATLDDAEPDGVALAVQAPERDAVARLLEEGGCTDVFPEIEIHDWEFGGRR